MLKGPEAGHSFESYILMELMAYRGLHEKDISVTYWRTKKVYEVDFVIDDGKLAIEVKLKECVQKADLKGIIAFKEEHPEAEAIVVSLDPVPRKMSVASGQSIMIFPWKIFLDQLWDHTLFSKSGIS